MSVSSAGFSAGELSGFVEFDELVESVEFSGLSELFSTEELEESVEFVEPVETELIVKR